MLVSSYSSFFAGAFSTITIQILILFILFLVFTRLRKRTGSHKSASAKLQIDSKEHDIMLSDLRSLISETYKNSNSKESCDWFRLLVERMFIQARFSTIFRAKLKKIMLDRLKKQFERLYWVHRFIIVDIDIGPKVPKINSVQMLGLHDACQNEELELELDVSYEGGLNFTLEVFILGGLMIPIRIDLNKLQGPLRIRVPSCRYSGKFDLSFVRDPGFDFSVRASIVLPGDAKKKGADSDRNIPLQQMLIQFLVRRLRSVAIDLWVMPAWRSFPLPMMSPTERTAPYMHRYTEHDVHKSLPPLIIDSPTLESIDNLENMNHMKSIFMEEFIAYLTSTSSYYPSHPTWNLVKKTKYSKESRNDVISLYRMSLPDQRVSLHRGCFVLPIPHDSARKLIETEQIPFVLSDQTAGTSIMAELNEMRIKECHLQTKKNQEVQTLHFLEGWYNASNRREKSGTLEWAVFYHSLCYGQDGADLSRINPLEDSITDSHDNKPSAPWVIFGYGAELIPESHEYVLMVMSITMDHGQPAPIVKKFDLDWNSLVNLYESLSKLYQEPSDVIESSSLLQVQSLSKSQPVLINKNIKRSSSHNLSSSDPILSTHPIGSRVTRTDNGNGSKAIVKGYILPYMSSASKWIKYIGHSVIHPYTRPKKQPDGVQGSQASIHRADSRVSEPQESEVSSNDGDILDYTSMDFKKMRSNIAAPLLDDGRTRHVVDLESSLDSIIEEGMVHLPPIPLSLECIGALHHGDITSPFKFIRSLYGFKIIRHELTGHLLLISRLSSKYLERVIEYLSDIGNLLGLLTRKSDSTSDSAIFKGYLPSLSQQFLCHIDYIFEGNTWKLESTYEGGDDDIDFVFLAKIYKEDQFFYITLDLSPLNLHASLGQFIQYIIVENISYKLGYKYLLESLWYDDHSEGIDISYSQLADPSTITQSEHNHHLTSSDFDFPFSFPINFVFMVSWSIKSLTNMCLTLSLAASDPTKTGLTYILPSHTYKSFPDPLSGQFPLRVPCISRSKPLMTLSAPSRQHPFSYHLHISSKHHIPPQPMHINTILDIAVPIKSKKFYILEFPISSTNSIMEWKFDPFEKEILFSIYHSNEPESLQSLLESYNSQPLPPSHHLFSSPSLSHNFILPLNIFKTQAKGSLSLHPFNDGVLYLIWKNPTVFTARNVNIHVSIL